MGSDRSVRGLPVLERPLEGWEVEVPVMARPGFAAGWPVGVFDPAVEPGVARGQDGARNAPMLAGGFEAGHELRSPIDLYRLDWNGHPRHQPI